MNGIYKPRIIAYAITEVLRVKDYNFLAKSGLNSKQTLWLANCTAPEINVICQSPLEPLTLKLKADQKKFDIVMQELTEKWKREGRWPPGYG